MDRRKRGWRYALVLAVVVLGPGLAGCNTVEGFGRDLERLGDTISGKAREKSQ